MKSTSFLLAALLAAGQLAHAQNPTGPAPARAEAKPATSLAAITQGTKKFDGYFPFYYDEKTGKVYLELNKFDQEFLYFSSLPDGVGMGGPERGGASSAIAKFVKVGPRVMLVEPNYGYRASRGGDEQRAVESAFAKSVLWGFAPVAVEGNKVLLDLTPFLVRDSQKIADQLGRRSFAGLRGGAAGGSAPTGYRLDESRSAVNPDNTKNFPKNTEFDALITFTGGPSGGGRGFGGGGGIAPDPNAVTVRMHQSFVELPDNKYHPRKFDPRSGFNQFTFMDFSAPMTDPLEKRFSRRHRLEKKNPTAKLSEPVKPIRYYVDRGAPPDIKKALIEGGAWWNQAFEAAGYKNAFLVEELPADADPMDIRYNVVNWVDRAGNPRAFSFGSSYIDPRTGEIIKGVVTLGSDRHRQDYLLAEGLLQPYKDGKKVPKEMEEMALARIRQLSAHEIGHTLGLYHNFSSSGTQNRGSVMDYPFPRFTLKADGTVDVSDAYAKGIGSWDKRAILWGYQDFPKGTDEDKGLDQIMAETLKQGHIFIPDIGGYVHPESHQWDDGDNAVTQLNKLMTVRRRVLDTFSANAIPANAPMATLQEVLVPMYLLHRYQVEAAAKSLGGLYFTHAVKNDGQTITRMVEPAEQWRAFDALLATVSPAALALPEKLLQQIPPRPSGYPGSMELFPSHTGPTFDPLAAAETAASTTITSLLNPERATRLIEYNARDSRQPGFMPMVDKLLTQTWKAPLAPGYSGQLQVLVNNLTLKSLLQLAADPQVAENVRGESLVEIDGLKQWMTAQLASAEPRRKANLLFGLSQINTFTTDPNKFTVPTALDMPPGAPIGMPGLNFLGDDVAY